MGNLSNQYISQSFQSLLHLGSDTTASATLTEIQDALGNGVGVFVNTAGNLKVNNHISASQVSASILNGLGNPFDFSSSVSTQLQALENVTSSLINQTGSYATTGSNTFIGNQNITGDVEIIGTLNATRINTTIESASVIFSSGSNILGDSTLDIQTLNGLVRVSGSSQITGSMGISANLSIRGEVSASYISSSRIEGLGGTTVSDFSQSVQQQFNDVQTYENNNDTKWNDLQPVTSSLLVSVNQNLNPFTASILGTNAFTASTLVSLSNLNASSASQQVSINNLNGATGSYATTGSNTFIGTETITGSIIITGSAYGNVVDLTISSNTASIDMRRSNFFTLTLASSATTRLEATNIRPGETVSVLITQPATSGSLVLGSMFKTNFNYPYQVTTSGSAQDLLSLVSFNDSSIYLLGVNRLQ
jgi:hypothetical protein